MTAIANTGQQLINRTLSEQMGMTEHEIASRKSILNITPEHEKLLAQCADHIHKNTSFLVEEFYEQQTKIEEIELLIGDADTLVRLQGSMVNYIHTLFGGRYGDEYVSTRLRIGLVHKRIGVPPKLYLCGIQKLSEILTGAINDYYMELDDNSQSGQTIEALERLLAFDVGLVFDTYIRSLTAEIEIGKDRMERHANDLEGVIKERTKELENQARNDPLTELFNQRTFYETLNKTLSLSKRYNHSVALIYMDLDGFKQLNDREGHQRGDEILKHLADVIRNNLRDTDSGARYGGDEFCVIMPNTSRLDASVFCQRLNNEFAELVQNDKLSISSGIAQSGPLVHLSDKEFIKMADENMYKAKEKMGYAVVVSDEAIQKNNPKATKAKATVSNLENIKLAKTSND